MSSLIKRFASIVFATVLWAVGAGAAVAASPTGVQTTLEGCRNNGTITLPNGSGQFVCPDAAYTTGNLGKGWNELDLVPHRLTVDAGNSAPASQTYTLSVALDNTKAGVPGYDVLSTLTKKSGSCAVSVGAQATLTPGVGGTDTSLARLVTITQAKNTVCVFDYYGRLALGSHLYSGSSLHANALNETFGTAGIGARDVSIPVKEIKPQELRKDMSATADSDTQWNITKKADPASIHFGDVCKADTPLSKEVTFRVEWIKGTTTSGGVNFVTNIYAKNPASRLIKVNVTDKVYQGTNQSVLIDTATTNLVPVPANTEQLVLTHSGTLPSSAGAVGDFLNDVATATYIDSDTGIVVPGQTTAVASAQIGQGVATNSFAAIADSESISGTDLRFSVAQPLSGAFTNYTAGTKTVGPVDWAITGQTTGGFVDFVKTVYLDARRVTSGTLTDTAVLVASPPAVGGFTKTAGPINVGIDSSVAVSLTVSKAIPPSFTLDTGERIEVTFRITRSSDAFQVDKTLTFGPGETSKQVVLTGLAPDTYTVTEQTALFFSSPAAVGAASNLNPIGGTQQTVVLTGTGGVFQPSDCAGTAAFTNALTGGPVSAQVRKITTPALANTDADYTWEFILNGPGLPAGGVKALAGAGAGYVDFQAVLVEGNYTVTETLKSANGQPWSLTSAAPDGNGDKVCEFTVDLPEDAGKVFQCTFNNLKYGKAKVVKTVSGQPMLATSPYAFTFQLRQGATVSQNGTTLESAVASGANLGVINFSTYLKPGDTYQLCEIVMPAWATSLGTFVPSSFMPPDGVAANPSVDNSILCANFTVAAGETKSFSVDNTPPPGNNNTARTIGYWKNWASCTSSSTSKKPVLDQTLAMAPVIGDTTDGHATLPGIVMSATTGIFSNFGPTYYLVVHGSTASKNSAPDCAKAVSLLDKSRIDNNKKMASDPAFNLAAQLMAAELNYTALAGKTGAATSAINQAVILLGKYKFDGIGHTNISAADATTMNNLAKTLDDYNNNR
jgi:hypothetical protein